jgi:DNA-binding NarL/FixJ family response regulator
MAQLPIDKGAEKDEQLFRRPAGVLLDEKQWMFLKERYHMTSRELQVAILICRGFSNDEITKALKIKPGTVKTHLRNIYRRTRVKSKVTLLLRFIEDVQAVYVSSQPAPPIPVTELPSKPSAASKRILKK